MKVLHVIPQISRRNGGPSRSSQGLVAAQCAIGIDAWLRPLEPSEDPWVRGVRYLSLPITERTIRLFDLVHIHELWHPKLHSVARICFKAGVPYVISPRGMLDPWALSVKKLKKLTALSLYQRADLRHAAAIHATSELEKRSIRAQGLGQSVIVSPNGVDFPEKMPPRISNGRVRTAIFLSRLHPGKGLLSLVEAWAQVRPQGWAMNIVGPDTYGHKAEVVKRLEHFGIQDQWHFVDMIDDVEKWKAYRSADLLIHPSVSENFGITIAEGLAAGLPVITTKGTPWEELVTRDCGWWIDVGVESLAQALKTALRISSVDMEKMGRNGQSLIKEKYTWAAAARLMIAGYQELLGAGVSTV